MSLSGNKRYDFSRLPNQSLAVSQCGLTICDAGHEVKTRIYGHYSAHFILEGKGRYTVNGVTYELGPGQGFMITPDIPNTYTADEEKPWKYIYVNFYGLDDETLVHYAGLNDTNVTFTFELDEENIHNLYSMYNAGEITGTKGYDVTGYFLIIMSRLVKAHSEKKGDTYLPEHYIAKSISYIEDNYTYNITVSDIAKHVGLNRAYFHRLFSKHLNTSPAKYLLDYRLKKAESLLSHKYLSLSDIALSTGFYDVSHFSKAFTSKYGSAPGKYRSEK